MGVVMAGVEVTIAGEHYKRTIGEVVVNYLGADDVEAMAEGKTRETAADKANPYVMVKAKFEPVSKKTSKQQSFDAWVLVGAYSNGDGISFNRAQGAINAADPSYFTKTSEWRWHGFKINNLRPLGFKASVTGYVFYDERSDNTATRLLREFKTSTVEWTSTVSDITLAALKPLPERAALQDLSAGPIGPQAAVIQQLRKPKKRPDGDAGDERDGKTVDPKITDVVREQAIKDGVVEDSMQALINKVNDLDTLTCPEHRASLVEELERAVKLLKEIDARYEAEQSVIDDLKATNDRLDRMVDILDRKY